MKRKEKKEQEKRKCQIKRDSSIKKEEHDKMKMEGENLNTTIFKEYDIRGTYPSEINEEAAYLIGKGYGSYLQEKLNQTTCVTGHDNRLSSNSLYQEMIKGIQESGCNVIDYGLVTTPMHYYSRHQNNLYGIMITASHNPKDDNGFKFSFDEYANARGKMIYDFRDYILEGKFKSGNGTREKKNIKDDYLKEIKKTINMGPREIKVVIDPGNGTAATIMKDCHKLFPNLNVTYICDESDGSFPNHHPDPAVEENLKMLKEKVLEEKADIGISYDGDGDRVGIIDELGHFIIADKLLIVACRALLHQFQNKTVLMDVKCSKALEDEIIKLGGTPYLNRTGTSYTETTTKKNNIPLGGELSGHLFFNDRGPLVGSGIYNGLRFLEILSKTDKSFSELLEDIPVYYSTPEIKITCPNDQKFELVEQVKKYAREANYKTIELDGVRACFDNGWALVRASNTGPNITLRFEAKDEIFLKKIEKEFTDLVLSLNKS